MGGQTIDKYRQRSDFKWFISNMGSICKKFGLFIGPLVSVYIEIWYAITIKKLLNLILTSLEIPPTLIAAGIKFILDKSRGVRPKENILPFKTNHLPKGYIMICANTHLINMAITAPIDFLAYHIINIKQNKVQYFEKAFYNDLWKIYSNSTLHVLADQYYALDFMVVKDTDNIGEMMKGSNDCNKLSLQTDVVACNDGVVLITSNMKVRDNELVRNFIDFYLGAIGNHIVIMHNPGSYSLYAHLQTNTIKVKPGQIVKQGDVIAKLGNTGNSSAPHLHFQMSYLVPKGPIQGLWFGKPLTNFKYEGRCGNLYKAFTDEKHVKEIIQSKPKKYHHASLPFFGFLKEI